MPDIRFKDLGKQVRLLGSEQVADDEVVLHLSSEAPPPPPPPPPPATLKEPNVGFMLRDRFNTADGFQARSSFINVDWASMEGTRGAFSGSGWTEINNLLNSLPAGNTARLRIFSGVYAPGWAKNLGGGAISITNPGIPDTGTVPRWWTREYLDAYAAFMTEVARRYDNDERVADVVMSGAMTFFAEPFIRSGTDTASNTRLFQAGLNEETDKAAFLSVADIHAAAFAKTRYSLATHIQWQVVDGSTDHMTLSWPKERDLLLQLRAKHGERLVIQNNGAGSAPGTIPIQAPEAADNMWSFLRAIDGPKGFQGGYKSAPPLQTLDRCVKIMGAWFFENIHADLTLAQVNAYQAIMLDNASM